MLYTNNKFYHNLTVCCYFTVKYPGSDVPPSTLA